jgi:phage terminase large subunit GpA-like protein
MGKVRLFTVGVETAKDTIAGHLAQGEPGPGYCHFPHYYGGGYFDQLLAERPIIKYVKGHRVRTWQLKRSGMRNEALDCRVYALAALEILGIDLNATVARFLEHVGGDPTPDIVITESGGPSGTQRRRYRSRGMEDERYARAG